MGYPEEWIRTRPLGHWSDSKTDITGKQAPEPDQEPEPEPDETATP